MHFKVNVQLDSMDCGPACLQMIMRYYGRRYGIQELRELCYGNRNGVTMLGISDAAESLGFRTMGVRVSLDKLTKKMILPCIVHWRQSHFVVVYKVKLRNFRGQLKGKIYVADPAFGSITYSIEEFINGWVSTKENDESKGLALMIVPSSRFFINENDGSTKKTTTEKLKFFFNYLKPYKRLSVQIILGVLIGMSFQLVFPFLSQALIDVGVQGNNMNFVLLVLITQIIFYIAQMAMNFIQSWITLHMTTRISIALRADFIAKLLILPMRFFESKKTGDILQRIDDHKRIQNFMSASTFSIGFSILNFFIFSFILGLYNLTILIIFLIGHFIFVLWSMLFLRVRRSLDYKTFDKGARNQTNLIQLVTGAPEIKLNNCERKMRQKWENIQADVFELSIKGLSYGQVQSVGGFFINNATNLILSVLSAKEVINGNMTLGMMMAISYMIGQLKGPISNFIGFMNSFQDAKISLERLSEVHFSEDENQKNLNRISELPENKTINIKNLTFSYLGPNTPPALNKLSIEIPEKKVTAIVGESGSGKTTLLKLLLGFYEPDSGSIEVGNSNLKNINTRYWRSISGAVMQDSFIFSESIAENIAISDEEINKERLYKASRIANIQEFIEELPAGYNTKIGQEGSGVSQGQKQRILIARAVYKNPEYIFFDEATNSLDANNERIIMENLQKFYQGKTVVVVAHRLSTVKNADQIIVLEKGEIIEKGNHRELIELKGKYFELIKNQLELA